MAGRASAVTLLTALSIATAAPGWTQEPPPLRTVLARLHHYLADYAERIPATIASEHVQQTSRGFPRSATLDSDFGIVRLPGVREWLGFRDVLTKDGKPVSERQQRLDAIFRNPSVDAARQARMVSEESARHNVGPFYRTINNPALVLELLDGRNEWRMKFRKTGEAVVEGMHTWIVRFQEVERPTVISGTERGDAPSEGLAWIDPVAGTLIEVEATVRTAGRASYDLVSKLTVKFALDPKLGFWVPAVMTERYETRRAAYIASGEATYSNYRLFTVDTHVIVHGTPIPNP
jgi:hypothetical protein